MGEQMRVDLSELEETVRKLRRVASDMSSAEGDSDYRTELAPRALGGEGFGEASELHSAHGDMQRHLKQVIKYLNGVIEEFGTNTKKAHGKYQDAEYEAKNATSGGQ